jgi:hypothetical protein
MDQPEVVQEGKKHLEYNFKKILYKLKQFFRVWYHGIDLFFINIVFVRSQANHLLYIKQTSEVVGGNPLCR